MQRGFWPPAAVRAVTVLALAATASAAFAQAGSVGGTIGNTDKSVSGGDERRPSRPVRAWTKPPAARREAAPVSPTALLAGSWQWKAQCVLNPYSGVFVIRQTSGAQFSGDFLSDIAGKLIDGKIEGDHVSFTRELNARFQTTQAWTATLTRSAGQPARLRGDVATVFGPCTWEATK